MVRAVGLDPTLLAEPDFDLKAGSPKRAKLNTQACENTLFMIFQDPSTFSRVK